MSNDELESRMRALEGAVRELTAVVNIDVRQLREIGERHAKLMYGNPENHQEHPGLIVRIDRLESWSSTRRRGVELVAGAALAVLAGIVTRYL